MNAHNHDSRFSERDQPGRPIRPVRPMVDTIAEPALNEERKSQQTPDANPGLRKPGRDHRRRSSLDCLSSRLREDFGLAIVTLFAGVALLTVLPFAIFRLISGDWLATLLDLGFLTAMVLGLVLAWRFGRTEWAGNLIAAASIAGVGAVILGFDQSPMWVLPALVASFLLAAGWFAAILSAGLISLVAGHDQAFPGSIERWIFVAASVQAALFSFIFSLRSSQRNEAMTLLAETDPLTGLWNRRALWHDLTTLVIRNRRQQPKFALAMLDLDHFKQVNDTYGHEAGDKVIEDFARILVQSTRESDRAYRFGGEEFVLILQGIDAAGLTSALGKLQKRSRELLTSPGGPVTVSIGATRVLPGDTMHMCFQRADQAMYKAKANGRDRVEIL